MMLPGVENSEFREATADDIAEIVRLVNCAFEVERFFKNTDRIDSAQISEMMRDGKFLLLTSGGELLASIYVKLKRQPGLHWTAGGDAEPAEVRLGQMDDGAGGAICAYRRMPLCGHQDD